MSFGNRPDEWLYQATTSMAFMEAGKVAVVFTNLEVEAVNGPRRDCATPA